MKTIKEWLSDLPEGYRERAIVNIDESFKRYVACGGEVHSIDRAILSAFDWDESDEGVDFWNYVYEHFRPRRNETPSPLPLLPTEDDIPEPVEANPLCNISFEKTLMDEFAMAVIPALISKTPTAFNQHERSFIVEWAYEYAKNMAEERKKHLS